MFQEFLEKYKITDTKIAVAVSGGADSLALMLMLQEELAPKGYEIVALTVDHGLRTSSADEAAYVKDIATQHHIEHHTILWQSVKPISGMEEAARLARYALLEDWCVKNAVHYLATAHHLYDQAETFLMRLERGSGLDGLCGMKEVLKLQRIFLLRPVLHIAPPFFKQYLKKRHIAWVEDESNQDEALLRVRMRHFLPLMEEKTGISASKIAETMSRLQASRSYFEEVITRLIKNNFQNVHPKVYLCADDFFEKQHKEIQYRLLAYLMQKIAQTPYPPESAKIRRLMDKMALSDFKTATLGHCCVIRSHDFLWFLPEVRCSLKYTRQEWKQYLKEDARLRQKHVPSKVRQILLLSSKTKNDI